ncbi:MAG: hypothetical protein ACQCN6_01660 [Candidatus Bathyarchaeia archaeon]
MSLAPEQNLAVVESVNTFLTIQNAQLIEFYQIIERIFSDFAAKYEADFEAQKAVRQKEYLVLEQLSTYLAKFG